MEYKFIQREKFMSMANSFNQGSEATYKEETAIDFFADINEQDVFLEGIVTASRNDNILHLTILHPDDVENKSLYNNEWLKACAFTRFEDKARTALS